MDLAKDLSFRRDDTWFRFRACAIILHKGKVLMATSDKIGYFYSIGGGVQHNESTADAVKREVFEECGVNMEIDRLLFINENFFDGLEFVFGETLHCHELAFYYLMKYDPAAPPDLTETVTEDGSLEHLAWISLDEYESIEAYPKFLARQLKDIKPCIEHILSRA